MAKSKKKATKKTNKVSKTDQQNVISTRSLIKKVLVMFRQNWKLFLIFTLVYAFFVIVFVQGPTKVNIGEIQSAVTDTLPENANNSTLIAGVLVFESTDIGQAGATYGMFLFFIFSLAIIWLLRAMYEGKEVRVRDGFYNGMYGLIPVLGVYVIIAIQLLPMAIGGIVFSIVSLNGLAVNIAEKVIVWSIVGGTIFVSVYFLAASIMAVYVATLPEVAPFEALKQAKRIVKGRRGKIMVRIFSGTIIYGLIVAVGLLLLIAIMPSVAVMWWWLMGVVALTVAHTYLYNLYRSLL